MSEILPPHPLDVPGSIKVILGREASETIAAHGDQFIAIISHPDSTSSSEATGRMILTVVPVPKQLLQDACNVALGKLKASKPKPRKSA